MNSFLFSIYIPPRLQIASIKILLFGKIRCFHPYINYCLLLFFFKQNLHSSVPIQPDKPEIEHSTL